MVTFSFKEQLFFRVELTQYKGLKSTLCCNTSVLNFITGLSIRPVFDSVTSVTEVSRTPKQTCLGEQSPGARWLLYLQMKREIFSAARQIGTHGLSNLMPRTNSENKNAFVVDSDRSGRSCVYLSGLSI